jgi:hypothetical protein
MLQTPYQRQIVAHTRPRLAHRAMAGLAPAIPMLRSVLPRLIGITDPVPAMTKGKDAEATLAFPVQIDYSPRFAFAPAGG